MLRFCIDTVFVVTVFSSDDGTITAVVSSNRYICYESLNILLICYFVYFGLILQAIYSYCYFVMLKSKNKNRLMREFFSLNVCLATLFIEKFNKISMDCTMCLATFPTAKHQVGYSILFIIT